MLIWIAVVATVLALVGMAGVCALIVWGKSAWELRKVILAESVAYESASKAQNAKFEEVFSDFLENLTDDLDRARDEWRQAATPVLKSQESLSDSLHDLLREIKVSKQLAQGTAALGEQMVGATDKIFKLVELIRSGPRTPINIAPTDEQIASGEESEAQQRAILDMLQGVSARVSGDLNESQE